MRLAAVSEDSEEAVLVERALVEQDSAMFEKAAFTAVISEDSGALATTEDFDPNGLKGLLPQEIKDPSVMQAMVSAISEGLPVYLALS